MDEYTSAVIAGIVRSISAGAIFLVALALIGCSSGFAWEGTWKGNHNLTPSAGENPYLIRTLGQVTLVIKSGAFEMSEAGVPYTGSVRYENEKAFLKIETRHNVPIAKEPKEIQDQNKEFELKSRKDGKIEFFDPAGYFKEPLLLERQPQSP